jgi:PadR family transcriptional regulator, regulatory protein PadR
MAPDVADHEKKSLRRRVFPYGTANIRGGTFARITPPGVLHVPLERYFHAVPGRGNRDAQSGRVVIVCDIQYLENVLDDETLATHRQELRRGTIVLACLVLLSRPNYGYALLDALEKSGFDVDANTLYPLLRRLEKQGLLTSEWNTDDSRPRKFYATSEAGDVLADTLKKDWHGLDTAFLSLKD